MNYEKCEMRNTKLLIPFCQTQKTKIKLNRQKLSKLFNFNKKANSIKTESLHFLVRMFIVCGVFSVGLISL